MREIKFRAWDKERKRMLLFGPEWDIDSEYEVLEFYCGTETDVVGTPKIKERFVLEQYTGLHDHDRKEIYEGDIIRDRLVQRTVFWDKEYAGFSPFCFYDTVKLFNGEERRFDLIGNIHENPELLKEKDNERET